MSSWDDFKPLVFGFLLGLVIGAVVIVPMALLTGWEGGVACGVAGALAVLGFRNSHWRLSRKYRRNVERCIELQRQDREFMQRLDRILVEDRDVLNRLGNGDAA